MTESNTEAVKLAEDKVKPEQPPLYKILLLNDDFTPMEFVIEVLKLFFSYFICCYIVRVIANKEV